MEVPAVVAGSDDVWDDSQEEGTGGFEKEMWERSLYRLKNNFGNAGYKEGISEAKERSLQRGFNQGLSEASSASYYWGQLYGIISVVALELKKNPKLLFGVAVTEEQLQEVERIRSLLEQTLNEPTFPSASRKPSASSEEACCSSESRNGSACGGSCDCSTQPVAAKPKGVQPAKRDALLRASCVELLRSLKLQNLLPVDEEKPQNDS